MVQEPQEILLAERQKTKGDMMREFAEKNGIKVTELELSNLEPEDLLGFPYERMRG